MDYDPQLREGINDARKKPRVPNARPEDPSHGGLQDVNNPGKK
jgi:hypothetical protein